jgi:TRAP-type C4-dicarboxylate transport system substrate-binding protein
MSLIARITTTAVALLVAACGGGDTQRTGGATAKTTVLTLANGNAQTDELQHFIDKVDELSSGRLRLKAVNDWRSGDKHYEKGLIEDVKAGKADLGWVGMRRAGRGRGHCAYAFEDANGAGLLRPVGEGDRRHAADHSQHRP